MNFCVLKIKDFEVNLRFLNTKFYCGLGMAIAAFLALWLHGASMKACVALPVLFLAVGMVEVRCNEKMTLALNSLWMLAATGALMYLPQYILGLGGGLIKTNALLLGFLFTAIVILFWFAWTRNARASVIISFVLLLGMAMVNYYVSSFRGEEITPADIFAFETAMNVASQYDYSLTPTCLYFLCLGTLYCFCGFCIPNLKCKWKKWNSITLFGVEAVLVIVLAVGLKGITPEHHFRVSGSMLKGFYINFLSKLNEGKIEEPEEYNVEDLEVLAEGYTVVPESTDTEGKPDIIVIMGEAFGDLRVTGELRTSSEVMPFYDSLQENAIKGKALVSVLGGGTSNSEFEVLTGFNMGNFPFKVFPYQQCVKDTTWSMAHYLRSQGYTTMATHPENELNWRRYAVYPELGFEEARFMEDYPGEDRVRGHISDMEMMNQIISWYEEEKGDTPLFYFGVTMQNHSPYDYADFEATVHLEGYSQEFPEVEQYLTLTQMTDKAVQHLVEYFETVENDVVIAFFGDHMSKLQSFYEEQKGAPLDSLQDELNQRTVPFFVWANYDIEEENVEYTSLNFLSNYIYEAAGLELPAYNQFLKEVQETVPAVSSYGYYSAEKGMLDKKDNMSEEEKEIMNQYMLLQYNGMFDYENANKTFFPLQEVIEAE